MDNKSWPWRKKSTEKIIVANDTSVKGNEEEVIRKPYVFLLSLLYFCMLFMSIQLNSCTVYLENCLRSVSI